MPDSKIDLHFAFYGVRLISTNDMYIPTARGKSRKGAFLRKSDELRDFQRIITESFEKEYFYTKEYLHMIASYVNNTNIGLTMKLRISIPEEEYWNPKNKKLYANDASNFIKAIEDAIYSNIGINDTRNIKLIVDKGYNEDGDWYVEIDIQDTDINNRIDVDTLNREVYFNE